MFRQHGLRPSPLEPSVLGGGVPLRADSHGDASSSTKDVLLMAAGKVWTRADAEALVALGADLVAVGRAAILNPDWPAHLRQPDFEPIRGPLSPAELAARDVSPRFVEYLRRFRNLVAD